MSRLQREESAGALPHGRANAPLSGCLVQREPTTAGGTDRAFCRPYRARIFERDLIQGWRANALTPGYFISRLQREDARVELPLATPCHAFSVKSRQEPSLTVGLMP